MEKGSCALIMNKDMVLAYDIGKILQHLKKDGYSASTISKHTHLTQSTIETASKAYQKKDKTTTIAKEKIKGLEILKKEKLPLAKHDLIPPNKTKAMFEHIDKLHEQGLTYAHICRICEISKRTLETRPKQVRALTYYKITSKLTDLYFDVELGFGTRTSTNKLAHKTGPKEETKNLMEQMKLWASQNKNANLYDLAKKFNLSYKNATKLNRMCNAIPLDKRKHTGGMRFEKPYLAYIKKHPQRTVEQAASDLGCSSATICKIRKKHKLARQSPKKGD